MRDIKCVYLTTSDAVGADEGERRPRCDDGVLCRPVCPVFCTNVYWSTEMVRDVPAASPSDGQPTRVT